MDFKSFCRKLLFPHMAAMLILIPISIVFLVCSMVLIGTETVIAIVSYVLAAYTLTVWCCRIPSIIRFFKTFSNENKYARRWLEDDRLRVNVSLWGALAWNTAYALFQLCLGIYHRTFWFCSLAVYYIFLAVMRFFLVWHMKNHKPGEKMREELVRYRACGAVFLLMNMALALIVFFMVYWNRTFVHHEITTISMAAYTFTSFTFAIINIVKYRKYKSPVYSASKAINLAAASVSILTLESTMLTTFGENENPQFRRIMLALTGAAITLFIIVMAVYMIVQANKGLKELKNNNENEGIASNMHVEKNNG